MTSNTRQRKYKFAKNITETVNSFNLSDQVDVLTLTLKQLSILDRFEFLRKPTRKGLHSFCSFAVREFWHEHCFESTNTTQLAKLRVSNRNKTHTNLEFSPSVTIGKQRNKQFYQSIWTIAEKPYKVLYQKFLISNPNFSISWGFFLSLRPFYIRHSTLKDMEMCCCLPHLHARWSINEIIQCAKKQNIPLESFDSYTMFFKALTEQCSNHDYTYISWQCTPDKKTTCQDISSNWECLKLFLIESSNGDVTVPFNYFQKTNITKKGKETKRLKLLETDAGMVFLVNFVDNILAKLIYHRNMLKYYRNTRRISESLFDSLSIDINFAENLTVQVKYEPQSLHWSHEQVTVHSEIMKVKGKKTYHPYFSDSLKHDQVFVKKVLEEMLPDNEIPQESTIVIESDNCTSQYKSAQHFHDLQEISTKYNRMLVRVFGIAGHGKGEIDHFGGLAKVAINKTSCGIR